MELHDYIRILRKNWITILLLTLLGAGAATTYSLLTTPKYETTAQLYVSVQSQAAATTDLVQGTTFARQIVTSYVDVVGTALVLDPVIDELDLDTTASILARQIGASAPLNTVLINITVTDSDPALAAEIANATGRSLADAVKTTLESGGSSEQASPVRVTVVQPAMVPTTPASPNVPLNIALGTLVGLALGVAVAVVRTVLDTRIHTVHDIEQLTDRPLLGGIVFDPEAAKRPLLLHVDPRSPRAESFRALRTNLQFLNVDGGPRSFVMSSARPGEGKSTTTVNLAIALAETGARVALLDGDLRLPSVAEYLGIEGGVGMTDVLIGRVDLADALQRWGTQNLFVLPSGPVPPNPSELLGSAAMDSVLAALTEHFDYVLIDAPPLLLVTDAAVLSRKTRGAILAVAAGRTRKPELEGAIRAIETASGTILGVVATMLPTKGPDSYSYGSYTYGYGYGYGYAAEGGKDARKSESRRSRRGGARSRDTKSPASV
ncbi:MAG: chromosome partitioning protein [Tistrella sp.]|nr:chromosome partitioning protein [Tistrella sp.]